ncbi:Stk1 family PASTA domain-containing Ser/Thr kinase [Nocardioides bigeumensis]|uniref:non-specific serine/threonine protein kinase n=1 Tax=Nocardioides bigeumensis TaxID=433657 RepID=A0ABN2XV58_9ACTN
MQSYRDAPARGDRGAGVADATRHDALTGRLLDGRYLVGARIARGGMASVYEATDTRLDRLVAVKVMHSGLGDDDEFAARFVREARSAARLSHPHVVGVFDQGEDDGVVFLAMEYVPGQTLRDVVRAEAPMRPARALALIEPVVSALAAAHRAGLIHRDVKPENVLIEDPEAGGRVKVADFGLAKAVSADTQHTVTGGVLIGTVSYLAPELVVDGRADARADVYAAGVMLYELLTGAKPHEGESPIAVAYKHVHTDVPAPSAAVPGIAPYVDALVARATSRDRTQRPADAGVLLHQIHRVAQAVRDGVDDDPELTADLAPRPVRDLDLEERADRGPDATVPVILPSSAVGNDTASDPFDAVDLANYRNDSFGSGGFETVAGRPPQPPAEPGPGIVLRDHDPVTVSPTPLPKRPATLRPVRQRRSRKGPILFVLALLLVIAGGAGAYWFGVARYTTTPGVIGLSQAKAEATLAEAGLEARDGTPAYSETVPAGEVLATDPEPGSRVVDAGTVTLVLSLGKERYDVPQLKGMTEDQAQDALAETSLGFGKSVERWNESVPEGEVIRSDPESGTTLKPDAAVDLIVSKGPQPIKVKDWTGMDADEAVDAMNAKGLEVEVVDEEYDDSVPEGHVLAQSPASGTLHRGDRVDLTVSLGPQLIAVPDNLIAMGVENAKAAVEAAGFEVSVVNGPAYIGLGYVIDVDPGGGTMLPKGSTVTLILV